MDRPAYWDFVGADEWPVAVFWQLDQIEAFGALDTKMHRAIRKNAPGILARKLVIAITHGNTHLKEPSLGPVHWSE